MIHGDQGLPARKGGTLDKFRGLVHEERGNAPFPSFSREVQDMYQFVNADGMDNSLNDGVYANTQIEECYTELLPLHLKSLDGGM